ncbi:MAG: hypothetical protein ACAH11_11080 [Sphingomonas sp.]
MSPQTAVNHYSPPSHQREVDAMMAEIRASMTPAKRPLFKEPPPRPALSSNAIDHRVAEELDMIRRRLDQIGDALIADPILLNRHAMSLQGLDLTNQILSHLAEVIKAEDKVAGAEAVKMDDLRARLKRRTSL